MADMEELREKLRVFARTRDWEQFHSPKNLCMALVGEIGELIEHFQWLTEEESRSISTSDKEPIADELADVLIYLVRLADQLQIDLMEAATEKIKKNEMKYPADRVRGSSRKYSDYEKSK